MRINLITIVVIVSVSCYEAEDSAMELQLGLVPSSSWCLWLGWALVKISSQIKAHVHTDKELFKKPNKDYKL